MFLIKYLLSDMTEELTLLFIIIILCIRSLGLTYILVANLYYYYYYFGHSRRPVGS